MLDGNLRNAITLTHDNKNKTQIKLTKATSEILDLVMDPTNKINRAPSCHQQDLVKQTRTSKLISPTNKRTQVINFAKQEFFGPICPCFTHINETAPKFLLDWSRKIQVPW